VGDDGGPDARAADLPLLLGAGGELDVSGALAQVDRRQRRQEVAA
jgi:hypothetical protein